MLCGIECSSTKQALAFCARWPGALGVSKKLKFFPTHTVCAPTRLVLEYLPGSHVTWAANASGWAGFLKTPVGSGILKGSSRDCIPLLFPSTPFNVCIPMSPRNSRIYPPNAAQFGHYRPRFTLPAGWCSPLLNRRPSVASIGLNCLCGFLAAAWFIGFELERGACWGEEIAEHD